MTCFTKDGHLTDAALRALMDETLDEMQRLEAAEHLSYCDRCLERYTALLTDDTLLTPAQPLAPPVLSRIRHRALHLLFNRYTTYAAAACLALALWGAGIAAGIPQLLCAGPDMVDWQPQAPRVGIAAQMNTALDTVTGKFSDALSALLPQERNQTTAFPQTKNNSAATAAVKE